MPYLTSVRATTLFARWDKPSTCKTRGHSTVVEITSGHWTISGQLLHVYGQSSWRTAAMSGQRQVREPAADKPSASGPPTKKRAVSKHTAEKWVKEFDKTLNSSVWLRFEVADRDHVVSLSCAVCSQFQSKLVGMRNYRASFVDSTSNVKTSSFKEHASTDMHVRAMHLFKKQQSTNVFEYAPIARALTQQAMDTLAAGAWCLTNSLSVRTKCTLTGHSVWTLPKNYFEHCSITIWAV